MESSKGGEVPSLEEVESSPRLSIGWTSSRGELEGMEEREGDDGSLGDDGPSVSSRSSWVLLVSLVVDGKVEELVGEASQRDLRNGLVLVRDG